MRVVALVLGLFVVCCGSGASSGLGVGTGESANSVPQPRCAASVRPQSEIDFAGLPPLVPTAPQLTCVLNASVSSSAYDAGYSAVFELSDGRRIQIYERRGSAPIKSGPSQTLRSGTRDVSGVAWSWMVLANGSTALSAETQGTYVELALPGDEAQVDTLVDIAGTLRPVESLPRSSAAQLCASVRLAASSSKVAAAFDSSAHSVVAWHEAPLAANGPRPISEWRQHPPSEPVAVCYFDGDFGPPRGPAPAADTTTAALPNYDRVVYVIGVDRRPIGITFGWHDGIPIRDPGR